MFDKIRSRIAEKQRRRYIELEELEIQIRKTNELMKRDHENILSSYQALIDKQIQRQEEMRETLKPFQDYLDELQKLYSEEDA